MRRQAFQFKSNLLTLCLCLLLFVTLAPLPARASGTSGSGTPGAAPTPAPAYTLALPLQVDGGDGRLYGVLQLNGQDHHIGVFSSRDGRSLASFPHAGPFALDAKGNRLFVISGRDQVTVLDARTGKKTRTVQVKLRSSSAALTAAPQYNAQTGHLLLFGGNAMFDVDPNTGQHLGSTGFDVPVQDRCRMSTGEPLPINRSFFDPQRRLVYLEFTTYVCTPWIGFTVVSYDLATEREVSRQGTEQYSGLAAGGGFYAESWHRFGIGTIWTELGGKPGHRTTGWSSGGPFQFDTKRNRLVQSAEGSVRVFDPAGMRLTAVVPQPAKGVLAAYDEVSDQVYFVDGEKLLPWPAAKLAASTTPPAKSKNTPSEPVRLVVPSPAWQQDKTLFATWAQAQTDTKCYLFNQSYMSGPLLLSHDGGKQWLQPTSGLPADCGLVSTLAVSANYAKDRTLLAGVRGHGIFKSTDGGATWSPSGNGLPSMGVSGIALSPDFATGGTAFASVFESGLQQTTDGGLTWQTLPTSNAPVIALSHEFARDGTLAVYGMKAGGGSVQLSEDGGAHWRELTTPSTGGPRLLSLAPGFARWHVMFAGDITGDLYRSADAGRTWQRVLQAGGVNPGSGPEQMQIAYGPNEERREVFLVVSGTGYEAEKRVVWGQLYRSPDGGQTWAEMDPGEGVIPTALAISPGFAEDRLLFLGTSGGRIVQFQPPVLQ